MKTEICLTAPPTSPKTLGTYQLPEGILPLAPRQPFTRFSAQALAKAVSHTITYPEKRGVMSRAARDLDLAPPHTEPAAWLTMETHLDGVNIPQKMADELVSLGFELDGFVRFNPEQFTDHFTLKFKLDARDKARRAHLCDIMRARLRDVKRLAVNYQQVEFYLETEVYSRRNRRSWAPRPLAYGWTGRFPLSPEELITVSLPATENEARGSGLSLGSEKRADIHVKIGRAEMGAIDREDLLDRFKCAGFYPVLTWAGNDIYTAQFQSGGHASNVFRRLGDFFDVFGGAAEMTLEPCLAMWRSGGAGRRLAAVPPLVLRPPGKRNVDISVHHGR